MDLTGQISSAPDGNFVIKVRTSEPEKTCVTLENHEQDTEGIWDLPLIKISQSKYPPDFRFHTQRTDDPALPYETYIFSCLEFSGSDCWIKRIDILETCWNDEDWNDQGLRLELANGQQLVFTVDDSIVRQIVFGFQPNICANLMEYMNVRLSLNW